MTVSEYLQWNLQANNDVQRTPLEEKFSDSHSQRTWFLMGVYRIPVITVSRNAQSTLQVFLSFSIGIQLMQK